MKILIITTYLYPDTAIGGIRPSMLAKYLSDFGHEITVIRSGELLQKPDANNILPQNIKIISYLGNESPADIFTGNHNVEVQTTWSNKFGFLPPRVRTVLKRLYNNRIKGLMYKREISEAYKRFELQKELIDNLYEDFDIVFATYGNLENVFAGAYAKNKYSCKYILDFRDLIATKSLQGKREYFHRLNIQNEAVKSADICTAVSKGATDKLIDLYPHKKIITIYNGFEKNKQNNNVMFQADLLTFCYTGTMYSSMRSAEPIFEILHSLSNEGIIDLNNIKFEYAGREFDQLLVQAQKYNVEKILVNNGQLSGKQTFELQCRSDIFVVLSWNTNSDQGVLTGKFYESLKSKKPVVACITGEKDHSELRYLIEKYNLGVCVEEADSKDTKINLREFVINQYNSKMKNNLVNYMPNEEVFDKFEYSRIAKSIEQIMLELCKGE